MSDQPGSSHFQALFEAALRDYEKQTGITLAKHTFAEQLESCDSAESVTAVLNEQARAFNAFREGNKVTKLLKNVVSASCMLSACANLGQSVGLVRQKVLMGFHVSDPNPHSIVISARNCHTHWPRYSPLCMYLS
jgi:hypothetical protein